jgi:hypothetical protein
MVAVLLFVAAGSTLSERFAAMTGENITTKEQRKALGSYEQRMFLIDESVQAIKQHPMFGIGAGDFSTYSGVWGEVHVTSCKLQPKEEYLR